jgi:hypothetical protein
LSSTIKDELLKEGVKEEAARQQISRARGGIYRLNEIKFPKREYFIYLKDQYKTRSFNNNLVRAFKMTSSAHKCIITGLNNFGGCVPLDKIKVLSGCPKARKKKKSFDQVIHELQAVGLINIEGTSCFLHDDIFLSSKTYTGTIVTNYLNDFLREILALWLKNNGLVSYNKISFCGDFCSYSWDITAPSYLLPLIRKKNEKSTPGFIVADIIPQYDIDDDDVDYYIKKIESCFLERNTVSFIPILLGYGFKTSTWNSLKQKNILIATVKNFFGEEIEKLLTNIAKLLETTNVKESNNLNNMTDMLNAVSKIEGPTNNLRGQFFELVVSYIAGKSYSGEITLNKKISKDGKRAEMDVLVINSKEIIVYECKGKKTQQLISEDDIRKWKGKIAFIYDYLKSNPENSNRRIIFNFWTTSDFTEEANVELKKISPSRYTVGKKNGSEVLAFSKEANLEEICKILKEYFIK